MNLETIRDRVRKVSGFTMPELYSDASLDSLVNEVYVDVCGSQDWPFLYRDVAVTVDAAEVDVDPPIRLLSSVTLTGAPQTRLQSLTVDEVDTRDPEFEGRPEFYARLDADRLLLWPAPDQAYQARIRGYAEVTPLLQPSDSPVFDAEFHTVLVYETAARLLAEYGDFDRVDPFRQQAQDALSRMRVRYLASKDKGLIQMGGRARNRRDRWRP